VEVPFQVLPLHCQCQWQWHCTAVTVASVPL
jgi:hypothetical protein